MLRGDGKLNGVEVSCDSAPSVTAHKNRLIFGIGESRILP